MAPSAVPSGEVIGSAGAGGTGPGPWRRRSPGGESPPETARTTTFTPNRACSTAHRSPSSSTGSISVTENPGIASRNGVVRYVHSAYPLKYARCSGPHGVSISCPANKRFTPASTLVRVLSLGGGAFVDGTIGNQS